jgi:hypothetical protein
MSKKQAKTAIAAIDRDGSGAIEFDEFAMWWVTTDHGGGDSSSSKMASLKRALQRRKWRRETKDKLYIKMRAARLAGKVSKFKSERERCIAYMESTVVDISMTPPSCKPVSLFLS